MKINDSHIFKISEGDKETFKKFFDGFFPSLCIFSFHFVKSTEVAEDIVQEAMISYWNKREGFDNVNSVKSFLYITTKNLSLNHLKKHSKSFHLTDYDEVDNDTIQEIIVKEEVYANLRQEIERLPSRTKQIIKLSLKGMVNADIAEQLEISVNTVKTLKKNAYAALKEKLKNQTLVLIMLIESLL